MRISRPQTLPSPQTLQFPHCTSITNRYLIVPSCPSVLWESLRRCDGYGLDSLQHSRMICFIFSLSNLIVVLHMSDWTFVSVNRIQLLPWWWCLRGKYSSNRVFEGFSNSGSFFQLGEVFPTRGGFWSCVGFLYPARFFVSSSFFGVTLGFWGPEDLRTFF